MRNNSFYAHLVLYFLMWNLEVTPRTAPNGCIFSIRGGIPTIYKRYRKTKIFSLSIYMWLNVLECINTIYYYIFYALGGTDTHFGKSNLYIGLYNYILILSGWPSALRRCVQVAVHICGRGFESHF